MDRHRPKRSPIAYGFLAVLLALFASVVASSRETTLEKYSRTLKVFCVHADMLRESMHQVSSSEHIHSFENTTGDSAPYSWRLVMVVERSYWASGIRLDRTKDWRSEYYSIVRTTWGRRMFCVPASPKTDRSCNLFAVVGPGTAYDAMASGEEVEVLGDSILLMDADLGDVDWMSPIDIDGSAFLKDPSKLPSPATADGRFVGFVDGVAYFLNKTVPAELIAKFIPAGKQASDRDRQSEFAPYLLDNRLPNPPVVIEGSKITVLNE